MSNIEIDLVIEARWVLPVIPHGQVLERVSVVVNDGAIIEVLPIEQARQKYSPAQRIELSEHILIPGLINLHTHAAMTLMRGLADDVPLMPWLSEHIWPAEKQLISPRLVRDGTLLGCAEMLAGGITCFNDMYFYPHATAEAAIQSGMRANLGLVVLEFPLPYANDADDYLQKGLEARDSWRGQPLLSSSLAPHAPYTVSNHTFEKVMTYAEQLGLGIHIHLHETQEEIRQSIEQYGVRPLRRLADLGILGPNLVAAHCTCADEADIKILAEYGCHVAHCPTSNLKLASGIAPVAAMVSKHVNVGIGTDGAASNNRLDMFAEMRMAALLAKGITGDATVVSAAEALQMATINGARALGMDDKIGSIEIGKLADLTAVKISSPETLPCFDPISHLVYVLGREHVSHVWVAGDLRYQKHDDQNGVYASIEPAELKEITSLWQVKLNQFKA
ncbi:N-ethylammeline chlorohydrolase [Methylovorus sp. MM2]|uniref:TRZ/ATZ family hydrolase n=1 Tax=Methylovorus sp. MM2 TaxID=1848038 RepID=UPI0007E1AB43|nr:TRZ/ATZ family hydrolase [Methylovorus sp. MM2]OAM53377.1 N-ethylammeline chlorohydrolase [Methylovorus sp. MM2]